MDFVREVQVLTGGFPAEYGRATGGIINVVTESGTNDFSGSLLTYYEDADWSSEAPRRTIRGNTRYDLGRDRSDWGGSLGGPIVRDRAWFFLSYDQRQNTAQRHLTNEFFGIDRFEDVEFDEHVYAGKATIGLTPRQSLTISAFGNPSTESGWLQDFAAATPEFMLRDRESGSTNASLRYDSVIDGVWTAEATAGRHRQQKSEAAATEAGRRVPTQADFSTSPVFYYGGYANTGGQEARRDSVAMKGSRYLDRHQLRFGTDYEKNRYDDNLVFQQYTYSGPADLGGDIGIVDYMDRWTAGFDGWGSNDIATLFLQDQWQISPRLSANLGIRYEEQELSSGKGVTLAVGRAPDGSLLREPASSVTLDGNWAPRLGIAWDPLGDGREKIYASAGRFFEAIPVHMNVVHMNGYAETLDEYYSHVAHTGSSWVNPNGSPLNENWTLLSSATFGYAGWSDTGPIAIDPNVGLQYQDEFSVGAEARLGRSWVAGVRYLNRQLGDVIEDHHVLNENGEAVDYVISNVGTGAFASDFRKPGRTYESIELTLQKYLTNRWQLMTSYVHSRARGDYDGLYNYINFNTGSGPHGTFDIEKPVWQQNTYGKLRSDVPHQFKLHGSYTFPFGLTLSEGFLYSSGTPTSAVMLGWPIGGVRMIYLLPRGSAGRTPDYYQLDLHADWRFRVGTTGTTMAIILDAYNVTEQDEALYVNEALVIRGESGWSEWIKPENLDENGIPEYNPDLPISPYYKEPRMYQPPMSFQLGVKLTF